MINNEKYSWEEPYTMNNKTEPIQSFEAFQIWVEMGSKRSLKAVAERMEKSHDTIKKYSCTWKWSERLQDKLSHENKLVYGKQLEIVLTGLEVDAKRDIILQVVLGNLLDDILNLSMQELNNLVPSHHIKTGKLKENTNMVLLEQITKIYTQLEKTHKENQQKMIDYTHKGLSVQSFKSTNDYVDLIHNGKEQYTKYIHDHAEALQKLSNGANMGGYAMIESNIIRPYKQQSNLSKIDNTEESTDSLPEPEPEQTMKKKRTTPTKKRKKKSLKGRGTKRRGRK